MIELEGLPELHEPVLVLAFEGWNDAAEAATSVLDHLAEVFSATQFAEVDPEDYYDFQVNRPQISVGDSGVRSLTWPGASVWSARLPDGRDLVLVRGVEPSMRWRSFASEVVGLAFELDVLQVVALGSLLADTPHTRPVPITAVVSDPGLARSLDLLGTHYEGPTGIVGVLAEAFSRAGIDTLSFWASVPHYVAQAPCPKASLELLRRVEDVLEISLPLGDLEEEARAWERGVDELASEDEEIADYVRTLEEARDTADLPEASGEAIAEAFERFLQRRDPGPDA
ncbi:MAG TPA: PAC2 family protein [Actinomycetes bacterium]|nr:PAC2 family protein [Actinomycetes bacterium]